MTPYDIYFLESLFYMHRRNVENVTNWLAMISFE